MRTTLLGLAAVLALTMTACSTDDDSDATVEDPPATSDAPDLPDCEPTWETGATLPNPYEGCLSDGDVVDPVFLDCSNGNGRYVQWDDGVAYAKEGAPVIDRVGQLALMCEPGNETGGYATPTPDDDFTRDG
jgi:hypothetical protein